MEDGGLTMEIKGSWSSNVDLNNCATITDFGPLAVWSTNVKIYKYNPYTYLNNYITMSDITNVSII